MLKVVTHLSAFRGEAACATWVWRIVRNHLLSARTRIAESPEQSLEALDEKLATGLSLADRIPAAGADAGTQVPSPQVLDIQPATCRQRLSRAKAKLEGFMAQRCGLVNEQARCRCDTQARVLRQHGGAGAKTALRLQPVELAEAERAFSADGRVADAAAVFRSLTELRAPERLLAAVRLVLAQEGFLDRGATQRPTATQRRRGARAGGGGTIR